MSEDFTLTGGRRRSRIYLALRSAANALAIAALLACAGVAMRDLAHSQVWHTRLWFGAWLMAGVGVLRIVASLLCIAWTRLLRGAAARGKGPQK